MKEFLSAKGYAYTEFDVSTDRDARRVLVAELGSRTTPTVWIDGDVLIGFNPAELALKLKQ